ncbi:hypothetical protein HA402_004812 [Bradysia odoriphaga]|nr:hypothetical protein HA402_004812 [Bradysia odoriphaga]
MIQLILIVLSVSAMAFASDECQFGSEAIQTIYDRYELFKKTKAFDPADSKIPLEQYSFYDNGSDKRLAVKINGAYIMEYYKIDGDNNPQTVVGQYQVRGGISINYKREDNGEFSFDDWTDQKKFKFTLPSIDAELPSNLEKDYKQVLFNFNALRKKMFDYQSGLSAEDLERVELFEFAELPKSNPSDNGFSAKYNEKYGRGITVTKYHNSDAIFGIYLCENKDQKYNIVDGKVIADGEPFVPLDRVYVPMVKPVPLD